MSDGELHDKRDKTRYRPLKANLLRELDLLLAGMAASDTLVIALSGHGVQFKGDPVSYFVPVDGKWTGSVSTPNGDFPVSFNFKADGATLNGNVTMQSEKG